MLKNNKWFTVAVCFILVGVLYGISINCFPLFIIPITKAFGFTRGAFGASQSLLFFAAMLSSAFSWKVYSRLGLVRTVTLASGLMSILFFMQSYARSLPEFYLLAIGIGFCNGLSTFVPTALVIRSWFEENVGVAIGIAFMGTGIGGMVFNQISNALILSRGYETAYRVLAALMLLLAVPAAYFWLRPGTAGTKAASAASETPAVESRSNFPPAVYLLVVCITILTITTFSTTFSLVPHLQDLKYSQTFAAIAASCSMAALAAGKFLFGLLLDRKGIFFTTAVSGIFHITGLLALALFIHKAMLIPVIISILMAAPYGSVGLPVVGAAVVSPSRQEKSVSLFSAAGNLGGTVSPLILGFGYDRFHSYRPVYYAITALCCAALVLTLYLLKKLQAAR